MRIDKFLWCVRLYKTRSLATDACRRGHVLCPDTAVVKPSHEVQIGDRIAVRTAPIWRRFIVLAIPESRVGAKLVPSLVIDITPWEDLEKQELARRTRALGRSAGTGRPTKRERRDIDRAFGGGDA